MTENRDKLADDIISEFDVNPSRWLSELRAEFIADKISEEEFRDRLFDLEEDTD